MNPDLSQIFLPEDSAATNIVCYCYPYMIPVVQYSHLLIKNRICRFTPGFVGDDENLSVKIYSTPSTHSDVRNGSFPSKSRVRVRRQRRPAAKSRIEFRKGKIKTCRTNPRSSGGHRKLLSSPPTQKLTHHPSSFRTKEDAFRGILDAVNCMNWTL
ncbi:hypothetical protein NPIL_456931 [Nephila pilipes]|uniref:Uncharacterized protein n=1 Tax=Nephila pilipes TaxID=299642 RepID=A0A8X6N7E0_NEPPI|nr:hypothetical protein NPIL_128801 [Nephila pilipes]GFS98673.1 hypothetical protein NPIL_456931 [Nephila pilipes]